MKSVFLKRTVKSKELTPLFSEYKKNQSLLSFGRFFNGYTHNDSFFVTLRGGVVKESQKNDVRERVTGFGNALFTVDTPQAKNFPLLLAFLHKETQNLRGFLARVIIVKTLDEYRFFPHVDKGYFYLFHERYHLVLHSSGTKMISGNSELIVRTGDIFYLDNLEVHSGKHGSEHEERVHVIFDIVPDPFRILKRYVSWLFTKRTVKNVNNMTFFQGLQGILHMPYMFYLYFFGYRNNK